MAVTKILGKNHRLDVLINYATNPDKTDEQVLTSYIGCDPGYAARQMMDTKKALGKTDGRQCYHIIQSFAPGEVTPELALEIAQAFAKEHLQGYQVVIGTHVDRHHIHSHIVFNSVNQETGEKYHSSRENYYAQIRGISDRLCREHGLSVIMRGEESQSMSYYEWLFQRKGFSSNREMLLSDMETAIATATDLGDFYMLMEHMGYEVKHGNRLAFRFRGQERYMVPERKNPRYSEKGIQAAIVGSMLEGIPQISPNQYRRTYRPYKKHPKYKGFLALYVHYLYILGKIRKFQYPPRMTAHLRQEAAKFERYREQFRFLADHGIETESQMAAYVSQAEAQLKVLSKQRTILNVQKKRRQKLYRALADTELLAPVQELYERGLSGMETEYQSLLEAEKILQESSCSVEELTAEKSELYDQLARINQEIRAVKQEIKMCQEIQSQAASMQKDIEEAEQRKALEDKEFDEKGHARQEQR